MQHLLSYYRKQAQMQQRVFEGMVGELKQARRTSKELARSRDENAALKERIAAWEARKCSSPDDSNPPIPSEEQLEEHAPIFRAPDPDRNSARPEPLEDDSQGSSLTRFYRHQTVLPDSFTDARPRRSHERAPSSGILPCKRLGSPMERARAALR